MNQIKVGDLLVVNGPTVAAVNDLLFIYKEDLDYFYFKNLTQNYEACYSKHWFEHLVLVQGHLVKL